MSLNRIKYDSGNRCSLIDLNLNQKHFDDMEGLYIIRHWWKNPHVVRVWQWNIRDRLTEHRNNPAITKYQTLWLYVTWASVPEKYRDWVEKYLGDTLDPLVGERFPEWVSTPVNLPW